MNLYRVSSKIHYPLQPQANKRAFSNT